MAQGFSLRFACERPQDRSSPGSSPEPICFLFFFNLVVLLFVFQSSVYWNRLWHFFKAWECGYNNNNIEENDKDYQRVFDTDSSAWCPHWQLNAGELKRSLSRTLASLSPTQGDPRKWEGAEVHKLFTVCTKQVKFPYIEHAASGI